MVKRIAHIQVIPKLSGVQRVSLDILSHLPSHYEKYIVFGSGYTIDDEIVKECKDNHITIIFVDNLEREISIKDVKAFYNFFKLFRQRKFDIIHTNSTKPGIIARFAAKITGCKKIVHTVHGIAFHKYEKPYLKVLYFSIEAFFSIFSDYLVSVNKNYLKYYPHIRKKTTIYNSVNFDKFLLVEKKEDKFLTIGFMSRLDYQKDPLTLCQAIKYGLENNYFLHDEIRVVIAGDGELKESCINYVNENELESIISFVGWVKDKNQFYSNIDIFCLPSLYEAFGLVLLESAFYNKPVIATNVEGIPEIIKNDYNGKLFEPKDYKQLARCIKIYCRDKFLIREHGVNGRRNLMENFNFNDMINKYIDLYED